MTRELATRKRRQTDDEDQGGSGFMGKMATTRCRRLAAYLEPKTVLVGE